MSESQDRSRPSIDIADFERRLRETSLAPADDHSDPLAELERLFEEPAPAPAVEPYRAERAPSLRPAPPVFVPPPPPPPVVQAPPPPPAAPSLPDVDEWDIDLRNWENELRGLATGPVSATSAPPPPAPPPVTTEADRGYSSAGWGTAHEERAPEPSVAAAATAFHDNDHGHAAHDDDSMRGWQAQGSHDGDPAFDLGLEDEEEPRRAGRYWLWAGVGAVALLAAGGAYGLRSRMSAPKDPPTILASTQPTKVRPDNAGGGDADPTVAAFDRRGDSVTGSKVVNNAEAPVDLSAQPPTPRVVGAPGAGGVSVGGGAAAPVGAPAPTGGDAGYFPTPKRVKTVSVRPDGSIIESDAPTAVTAPRPPARPTPAATPAPAPSAPPPAAATTPQAKPATPKTTARVTTPAKPETDGAATPAATQHPRPAPKPAKPATIAANTPPSAAAAPAAAGGGGGFSVQFAAAGSESEAHDRIAKAQGKFAGALGGHKLSIVKGVANGGTVYRVRVTGLSKDGAADMCTHVKENGGSCFVAKD